MEELGEPHSDQKRKADAKRWVLAVKKGGNIHLPSLLHWIKNNPHLSVKVQLYYPGERKISVLTKHPSKMAFEERKLEELTCTIDITKDTELPKETEKGRVFGLTFDEIQSAPVFAYYTVSNPELNLLPAPIFLSLPNLCTKNWDNYPLP
nr:PREDICTED: uncharacterized protein LOC106706773 [Latimeria chalumnae]|eukprot:XP_014353645.1 PREDICTED: uncharacterized protein LOC106706773 [Latimeria chalumnae]